MYSSCRCTVPSRVQGPGALSIQPEPRNHTRPLTPKGLFFFCFVPQKRTKERRHRVCFEKGTIIGFESNAVLPMYSMLCMLRDKSESSTSLRFFFRAFSSGWDRLGVFKCRTLFPCNRSTPSQIFFHRTQYQQLCICITVSAGFQDCRR